MTIRKLGLMALVLAAMLPFAALAEADPDEDWDEHAPVYDWVPELDVLYMTRLQRERFATDDEYECLKNSFILTPDKLANAKEDMCILHPLPRVNEISVAVDDDPRAKYFEQALNGKYMRMALIMKLLAEAKNVNREAELDHRTDLVCDNPRCITATEQELKHKFVLTDEERGTYRCIYCETKAH